MNDKKRTIKEIAEEIGVSKKAVFKRMKQSPLQENLSGKTCTEGGRLYVSEVGAAMIRAAFETINQKPGRKTKYNLCEDRSKLSRMS